MIKGMKKSQNKAFTPSPLGISHVPSVPCAGLQNGPPAAGQPPHGTFSDGCCLGQDQSQALQPVSFKEASSHWPLWFILVCPLCMQPPQDPDRPQVSGCTLQSEFC